MLNIQYGCFLFLLPVSNSNFQETFGIKLKIKNRMNIFPTFRKILLLR